MDASLSNSTPMDPLNVITVYASSIKPSLPYLGPLRSASFLFSLALALQSCSRRNLSFALSRFIGVELHGEESSIAIHRTERFNLARVQIWNAQCTYADRQTDVHTCTSCVSTVLWTYVKSANTRTQKRGNKLCFISTVLWCHVAVSSE